MTIKTGDASFNVADRLAIINVLNSYGYLVDELQLDDFFDLFADAPTIEFWHGETVIASGWNQFRELTVSRQEKFRREKIQRRHVLSAPRFDTQGADSASGHIYLQLFRTQEGRTTLVTLGYYDFTAVRQRGEWKLERWISRVDLMPD